MLNNRDHKHFPASSCVRGERGTQALQHLDLAGTSEEHNQGKKSPFL